MALNTIHTIFTKGQDFKPSKSKALAEDISNMGRIFLIYPYSRVEKNIEKKKFKAG